MLSFERGAGPYLYDADGNELLDYTLAWGLLIAGSCHPRINAAVRAQLERSYALGAAHEAEVRLAERLAEVLPEVERVTFASTGSEIVQVALRLARAATGRDKILKFEGHYHGWMNNVLVSHHPAKGDVGQRGRCRRWPPGSRRPSMPTRWWRRGTTCTRYGRCSRSRRTDRRRDHRAAAGQLRLLRAAPGYLEGMLEIAHAHGALVIFDEVITGFRLALGGAREYYGLTPDLSVYAKAVAGGFPLAAIAGSAAAFAPLLDGRTVHSGSNNGSPVAVAAALATLEVLSEPGTYDAMHAHGHAIRRHLDQEARRRAWRWSPAAPAACSAPLRPARAAALLRRHAGRRRHRLHPLPRRHAGRGHLPAARRPLVCRRHSHRPRTAAHPPRHHLRPATHRLNRP